MRKVEEEGRVGDVGPSWAIIRLLLSYSFNTFLSSRRYLGFPDFALSSPNASNSKHL
jgi:hypothetical protein